MKTTINRVIVATLPLPPSANIYWRVGAHGTMYKSEQANSYTAHIAAILHRCEPFTGSVEIAYELYMNRKSGDVNNRNKVLDDALQGYFFADDNQIVKATITLCAWDYDNPRVIVRCWKTTTPPDVRVKPKDRRETVYGYQELMYALTQDDL